MRRRLAIAAAIALAALAALAVGTYLAGEQTEVALLRTFDSDGTVHETKLWVVDDGGSVWVRVARPQRRWLRRIEREPRVTLVRHGVARGYRATAVRDLEARARVDRLMAEKYGRADWWYGLLVRSQPIPVRLDPEP
jgi:hypothetical protein